MESNPIFLSTFKIVDEKSNYMDVDHDAAASNEGSNIKDIPWIRVADGPGYHNYSCFEYATTESQSVDEVNFHSQSFIECLSQSQSSDEFHSQGQSSVELKFQSYSSDDSKSKSQCSDSCMFESDAYSDDWQIERTALESVCRPSGNTGINYILKPRYTEETEYESFISKKLNHQSTNLETSDVSDDSKSSSSYFGDNENRSRYSPNCKSDSSLSVDIETDGSRSSDIGRDECHTPCSKKTYTSDCEFTVFQRFDNVGDLSSTCSFTSCVSAGQDPAEKLMTVCESTASSIRGRLSDFPAPFTVLRENQVTGTEQVTTTQDMKRYDTNAAPTNLASLESDEQRGEQRLTAPLRNGHALGAQTSSEHSGFLGCRVPSDILCNDERAQEMNNKGNIPFKNSAKFCEPQVNCTFEALCELQSMGVEKTVEDKPNDDQSSVSTFFYDPDTSSSKESFLDGPGISFVDDISNLDSHFPHNHNDSSSLSDSCENTKQTYNVTSCFSSDFQRDHGRSFNWSSKTVFSDEFEGLWKRAQESSGKQFLFDSDGQSDDKSASQTLIYDKNSDLFRGHTVNENHAALSDDLSDKDISVATANKGRPADGANVNWWGLSKKNLTDEGFVSQKSIISCKPDDFLPLISQNISQQDMTRRECGDQPSINEDSTVALSHVFTTGEHANNVDKIDSAVQISSSEGFCSSLCPTNSKPVDVDQIAHKLVISTILSALSDLSVEMMDVCTKPEVKLPDLSTGHCITLKTLHHQSEERRVPDLPSDVKHLISKFEEATSMLSNEIGHDPGKLTKIDSQFAIRTVRVYPLSEYPSSSKANKSNEMFSSVTKLEVKPNCDAAVYHSMNPVSRIQPIVNMKEDNKQMKPVQTSSQKLDKHVSGLQMPNNVDAQLGHESGKIEKKQHITNSIPTEKSRLLSVCTMNHIELFELKPRKYSTYERLMPAVDQLGDIYVVDRPNERKEEQNNQRSTTKKETKRGKKKMYKRSRSSSSKHVQYGIYIWSPTKSFFQQAKDEPSIHPSYIETAKRTESTKVYKKKKKGDISYNNQNFKEGLSKKNDSIEKKLKSSGTRKVNFQNNFTHLSGKPPESSVNGTDGKDAVKLTTDREKLQKHMFDSTRLQLEDDIKEKMRVFSCDSTSHDNANGDCAMFAELVIRKVKEKLEKEFMSKITMKQNSKVENKQNFNVLSHMEADFGTADFCEHSRQGIFITPEGSSLCLFNHTTDGPFGSILSKSQSSLRSFAYTVNLERICKPEQPGPFASQQRIHYTGLSSSILKFDTTSISNRNRIAVYDNRWSINHQYRSTGRRSPSQLSVCPFNLETKSTRYHLLMEPQQFLLSKDRHGIDMTSLCLQSPELNTDNWYLNQSLTSSAHDRYAGRYYSRRIQCSLCRKDKEVITSWEHWPI